MSRCCWQTATKRTKADFWLNVNKWFSSSRCVAVAMRSRGCSQMVMQMLMWLSESPTSGYQVCLTLRWMPNNRWKLARRLVTLRATRALDGANVVVVQVAAKCTLNSMPPATLIGRLPWRQRWHSRQRDVCLSNGLLRITRSLVFDTQTHRHCQCPWWSAEVKEDNSTRTHAHTHRQKGVLPGRLCLLDHRVSPRAQNHRGWVFARQLTAHFALNYSLRGRSVAVISVGQQATPTSAVPKRCLINGAKSRWNWLYSKEHEPIPSCTVFRSSQRICPMFWRPAIGTNARCNCTMLC